MLTLPEVFLVLSLVPAALDDFVDYYVDDFMWLPTIPVVIYSLTHFPFRVVEITPFYIVIFIPVYIVLNRLGEGFGEGDMILYFLYIFYASVFGGLAAYLMLVLMTNTIGLFIPYLRRLLGLEGSAIPLISAGPAAIAVTAALM